MRWSFATKIVKMVLYIIITIIIIIIILISTVVLSIKCICYTVVENHVFILEKGPSYLSQSYLYFPSMKQTGLVAGILEPLPGPKYFLVFNLLHVHILLCILCTFSLNGIGFL